MKRTVIQHIAGQISRLENTRRTLETYTDAPTRQHALANHMDAQQRLADLAREHLPSGSGFDAGSAVIEHESKSDKIVIKAHFHHMTDNGFYWGWTAHKVIVRPAFDGVDIRVTGRDRDNIKDYIADTFHHALTAEIESGK
jgi:hypothetical protein